MIFDKFSTRNFMFLTGLGRESLDEVSGVVGFKLGDALVERKLKLSNNNGGRFARHAIFD